MISNVLSVSSSYFTIEKKYCNIYYAISNDQQYYMLLLIFYVLSRYYVFIKLNLLSLVTIFDLRLDNILNYAHYLCHLPVCNTHDYCSLVCVMSHKSSTFIHLPSTHYSVILFAPQVHHTHTTPPREHDPHTPLQHTKFPTPTSYFLSHRDYIPHI